MLNEMIVTQNSLSEYATILHIIIILIIIFAIKAKHFLEYSASIKIELEKYL